MSAIDPVTGKPYSDTTVRYPWYMQGSQMTGTQGDSGPVTQEGFGYYDVPSYSADWLKSIGYTGGVPYGYRGVEDYDKGTSLDPAFTQWLQDQGITLGMGQMKGGGESGQDLLRLQAFKGGNPFGDEHRWTKEENDPAFAAGLAGMAAFMGNFALASSAAGAGGSGLSGMDLAADAALGTGNNIATAGGALGGASGISPVLAGEFGELGYGAGSSPSWMTQLKNGDVAGAIKSGGSGLLDWATANPSTALKLLGTLGGGLLGGLGSGGSGGGKTYTPKMMGGTFNPSAQAQYQPVQQQTGLLSSPQGNQNSGLWQYMSNSTDPRKTTQPVTQSLWSV